MKVTTDGCLFGAWVANEIQNGKEDVQNVLDIGAGTGLLSLMLAQKKLSVTIDALEIDETAAKQASENAQASPWKERIHIICADAKEYHPGKKYDVIISNPPFYENELKSGDKTRNTAHHNEGLLLEELSAFIKENLSSDGCFYLLLPYKRSDEIKKLLLQHYDITQIVLVRQSTEHGYFRVMLQGKLKSGEDAETGIEEMAITEKPNEYTADFIGLLKDYYLHL